LENSKTYYLYNGNLEDADTIEEKVLSKDAIYEVMKVIEAKPLFFEDHIERFHNSMKKMGYTINLSDEEILKEMILLTRANLNKNTNIQIVYIPIKDSEIYDFMVSFTDGLSPSKEQKENGVIVETVAIERENPAIKTVGASFKKQIKSQSRNKDTFEILLVNNEGYITEGSRSNVFFVKDGKVITAPAQNVLLGVTRKYILELCEKNQIEVEYRIYGHRSHYHHVKRSI